MNCIKGFGKRATVYAIVGIKGDEFGERIFKTVFNDRRRQGHSVLNRIIDLIPKTIALVTLEFLTGESRV